MLVLYHKDLIDIKPLPSRPKEAQRFISNILNLASNILNLAGGWGNGSLEVHMRFQCLQNQIPHNQY